MIPKPTQVWEPWLYTSATSRHAAPATIPSKCFTVISQHTFSLGFLSPCSFPSAMSLSSRLSPDVTLHWCYLCLKCPSSKSLQGWDLISEASDQMTPLQRDFPRSLSLKQPESLCITSLCFMVSIALVMHLPLSACHVLVHLLTVCLHPLRYKNHKARDLVCSPLYRPLVPRVPGK